MLGAAGGGVSSACVALAGASAANQASTSARPLPAPKPLAAPAEAIGLVDGMSYVVLKSAPTGARSIGAEFVEYRLSAWSADGITRLNGQADGVDVALAPGAHEEGLPVAQGEERACSA